MTSKIEELKAKQSAAWFSWQKSCDHKDRVRDDLNKATWAKVNQTNIDTMYSQFNLEFDLAIESEEKCYNEWANLSAEIKKLEGN